jgi:16S rRNA (adenine1518-N6/adenine1519-N6)-dimethyltransferase
VTLSAGEVRALAARLDLRPTKRLGQNFVTDANTVRRIVALAGVGADDIVLEVGPGLGSLTLALLPAAASVVAVELDPVLAAALPGTVAEKAPELADRLHVVSADAMAVTAADVGAPDALVANLPYNVSVPVLLHLLAELPSLRHVLVMVQREVAERMAAGPGSRTYGVPSVKAAWYGQVSLAGPVPRSVFWPVPNVDSALVRIVLGEPPASVAGREAVFAVIDAGFSQRRKMLRSALATWAGSAARAQDVLARAGVDPTARAEQLALPAFVAIADAAAAA